MIDISSIKPGDKVTVEATVEAIGAESARISIKPKNERADLVFYVGTADLVSHTPAPREIKVGDYVLVDGCGSAFYADAPYKVKHIDGSMAWVCCGQTHTLRPLAEISHAPPPR